MCSFDFKESGNRDVHVDALVFGGSCELCSCSVANNIFKSFYFFVGDAASCLELIFSWGVSSRLHFCLCW